MTKNDTVGRGASLDLDVGKATPGISLQYDGSGKILGLPTRADLVRLSNKKLTTVLAEHISNRKPVLFMPVDVNETVEYINGVPLYKLHLFGVLPNGAKSHLVLDGIEVYFDVRVPEKTTAPAFEGRLRQILLEKRVMPDKIRDVNAIPVRGYRTQEVAWKRLYYPNVQERKKAIGIVREAEYETASDDLTNYFRMVARVYNIVLSDWGSVSDYEYYRGGSHPEGSVSGKPRAGVPVSPLCEHIFRADIKSFRPFVDPTASEDVQDSRLAAKMRNIDLARDKTLVMTWDIETYDSGRSGDGPPRASNPNTRVFMICLTVHWKDDTAALYRVCLVDIKTEPDSRWITIECGSEENLIKAFAVAYRHFSPDIIVGFNDGDYDWPYVLERAQQYNLLAFLVDTMSAMPRQRTTEDGVSRWNIKRDKRIKISADKTAIVTFLQVPGCIPIDSRVMMQQLHPSSEVVDRKSSLNFYLSINNLQTKAEMHFYEMWDIYEAKDPEKMRHVAHYCIIDAFRCQELLERRTVIADRREVASESYVSLYDAVYYANGHKVCNMIAAHAHRANLLCSNISDRSDHGKEKYPGAWVFPPEKGLIPDPTLPGTVELEERRAEYLQLKSSPGTPPTSLKEAAENLQNSLKDYHPGRPGTGLDFASLYPSIIITYNLSPDKYVETPEEAKILTDKGHDLYYVEFPFGGHAVRGWFVRHRGVPRDYGLYPRILHGLFARRSKLKKSLFVQADYKEHMELLFAQEKKLGGSSELFPTVLSQELGTQKAKAARSNADAKTAAKADVWRFELEAQSAERKVAYMEKIASLAPSAQYSALQTRYREACFDYTAIDSKQKAVKVFMNTFYGEAGHSISPFFLLQIAGGVTTAGKYNIKKAAEFVISEGYQLKYGDTDSLYICSPEKSFASLDRRYAFGEMSKESYWEEMVRITMTELDVLRGKVNAMLKADNGTNHLTMAYEEVLYPVAFVGKKKYYGIAHLNVPNFHPKKLFVKGIEVVKQGQPPLAKQIGSRIMWKTVSIENTQNLFQVVKAVLKDAVLNSGQWKFEDFIKTAAWKPLKNNKPVQLFMSRMKAKMAEEKMTNDHRVRQGLRPFKTLYYIPTPGGRFEFVLTKPGGAFSLEGLKVKTKVGDIMEYADVAKELHLRLDVAAFLKSNVIGLCARFINYADRFTSPNRELTEAQMDKNSQEAAQNYLELFVGKLQNDNPTTIKNRGYAYKRAWRGASQECNKLLFERAGPAAEMFLGGGGWKQFLPAAIGKAVDSMASKALDTAESIDGPAHAEAYARLLGVDTNGSDIGGPFPGAPPNATSTAVRLYRISADLTAISTDKRRGRGAVPLRAIIMSALDRREAAIRTQLSALVSQVGPTALEYDAYVQRVVDLWRRREHEQRPADLGEYPTHNSVADVTEKNGIRNDAPDRDIVPDRDNVASDGANSRGLFTPEVSSIETLKSLRRLWFELVGVYRVRVQHRATVEHLASLKDKRNKHVTPPSRASMESALSRSVELLAPMGIEDIGNGEY